MAQERGGHLGEHKTREKVARLFYWPALTKDVAAHCRSCATCQQYNRSNPRKATLQEREVSSVQFDVVCIDLVWPLPKGKVGVEYILTLIDQASRWPEATALKSISSSNVIKCLSDMFSRIGFPKKIVSDNRIQFTSGEFAKFCTDHGINHSKSAPYHPESNRLVERFHGSLLPIRSLEIGLLCFRLCFI